MIFYFTGTGNCKHVAEKIAVSENDKVCSITQAVRENNYTYQLSDDESVGFLFPVYFGGVPSIVKDFIDKMELVRAEGKYIYLVLTCGEMTCDTGKMFTRRMAAREYKVSAMYAVKMVDNYILLYNLKADNEIKERLINADTETEKISQSIRNRKTGDMIGVKGIFPVILTTFAYPFYNLTRKTKKFYATDTCTGCGLCAKICPCEAIVMKNGKPEWVKEKCVQCLGCLHRCPTKAIQFGKGTLKRGRYINPEVEM